MIHGGKIMPEWVKTAIDGWGTEIISIIISGIIGGIIGFHKGKRSRLIQKQKAGQGAKQTQTGFSVNINTANDKNESDSLVKQFQIAGDNAEQSQIGGGKNA
jgi:hypothetical protein